MYLLVGSIVPFSDAQAMIALGSPRWLLCVLGLPLLVGFVWVLGGILPLTGLGPDEPIWKWLLITEVGLGGFLAFMATAMFFMPVPPDVRLPTACFVSCYAACYAIAAVRGRRSDHNGGGRDDVSRQSPLTPTTLCATAAVIMAAEWILFGRR